MFLATTALNDFWETEKDILFLGKWCLLYSRRKVWGELNYKILAYPWDNQAAFEKAQKYCKHTYKKILPILANCLNIINKKNNSIRYWEIIIGPWLLHYVHSLYDRYSCLMTAFKEYHDLETICLSESSYVTPIDLEAFKLLSTDDPYNLQL